MTKSRQQGSSVSTKQLARTVLDGRPVFFYATIEMTKYVRGYLTGMDDYHYFVVSPVEGSDRFLTMLLHKSAIAVMVLGEKATYTDEPAYNILESLVAPYRAWLQTNLFGKQKTEIPKDDSST